MKVVDASVALGWVLAEPPSAEALRVLDDHLTGRHPLVAPELLNYEVGNVLARGARLAAPMALEAYRHFLDLGVETYSLGPAEYESALALACERGLTVYDASYAALAAALGTPLVTADRRLAGQLERGPTVELIVVRPT